MSGPKYARELYDLAFEDGLPHLAEVFLLPQQIAQKSAAEAEAAFLALLEEISAA